ncbi:hypothetical protein U2F10_21990 [Leptothoe sp. EHU-05/26/07-4]
MKLSIWIYTAVLSSTLMIPMLSKGIKGISTNEAQDLAVNSYGFCDDPVNDPSGCRAS